ncbi:predicted protein, partial [Nematostella vectensis]
VSPDHCHYQGSIRGVPDSLVVLHTCSGLKGIIDDGENTYNIEPHDDPEYQRYHNNTKTVTDRVIIMCNAVDAIYQRINIRLVMKHIDIWTNGDRMERQTSGGAELGKFKEYRTKYITPTIPHDNAQFL